MGIPLPASMTVIRLQDGGLVLRSPTRYTADLHWELNEIGSIRHLIAPNSGDWTMVQDWQQNLQGGWVHKRSDAPVTVATVLAGKRDDVRSQCVLIGSSARRFPLRRSMLSKYATGEAL
jgi:hypothetical protein